MYLACAHSTTAQDVVNDSVLQAIKSIKKAKLRSSIAFLEKKRSFLQEITDVRVCVEDTYLSDWRPLGFNKLDFGWGDPVTATPGI